MILEDIRSSKPFLSVPSSINIPLTFVSRQFVSLGTTGNEWRWYTVTTLIWSVLDYICVALFLGNMKISVISISLYIIVPIGLHHWQSYDCHSASEATLMNIGKWLIWIDKGIWYNQNQSKQKRSMSIFCGTYDRWSLWWCTEIVYALNSSVLSPGSTNHLCACKVNLW